MHVSIWIFRPIAGTMVLLLNKQITEEALDILYRMPGELLRTPGTNFTMRQTDIAAFICEHLLQRI
ncbi:hypothetical protein BDV37DRAFT_252096 [Aspergillus pseudonomiae]|uniref:Uncharacterized protein n=1 Tax=Aspergillus pseudonomiae TaxID=1506151 RepID=A0A5N7D8R8_9EURO|nr:uncharacterized protein BDV37DRAFT_252096 [Aspergillus pseudonomiae]KAE8402647.1 hypothetical protein BDV37DRAFT_252096 [Aspergillus pseudonomiae]